jgi:hypothetical protein
MVRNATCSATSSALVVAVVIAYGKHVANELDRLADHVGEPRGKSGMFKRLNGASKRRQVGWCHACQIQHRLRSLRHRPASPVFAAASHGASTLSG